VPKIIRAFVRYVDAMNRFIGRIAMYLIFVMIAVLIYSSVMKTFFQPSLFTLEIAQFLMVAYFLLGGPYSMQTGDHVRMDLLYGAWSDRTRAWVDVFTSVFLFSYLIILLYGGLSSTSYALGIGTNGVLERKFSAWRPYMWPIKSIMTLGIFLMFLQAISALFKDIARIRGETL